MTTRFEVGQWRTSPNGKKYFQRLGSAKANDDGGFSLWLEALPMPRSDNHPTLTVKPERDRVAQPVSNREADPDDESPF
jgi:hypothetical protein